MGRQTGFFPELNRPVWIGRICGDENGPAIC